MVAITGTGEFYSSGNDLSAMISHEDPEKALAASRPILENLIRAFYTFPKVLICVANGPCIGIVATTAILCDVIHASDTVTNLRIMYHLQTIYVQTKTAQLHFEIERFGKHLERFTRYHN